MKEVLIHMTFGLRLRAAREAKGLTQAQLAAEVGNIKVSVVSMWENNRSHPDFDRLTRLCKILNITSDELIGVQIDEFHTTREETERNKKIRVLDEHGREMVDFVVNKEYERVTANTKKKARMLKIDFYNDPASAGTGGFLDNDAPEQILVQDSPEAEHADFVIPVRGNSMEPTFYDGSRVFVKKTETVNMGEVGIFVINGEVFIKELGDDCLISHNKEYRPRKFSTGDSVYCCGKVLGVVDDT